MALDLPYNMSKSVAHTFPVLPGSRKEKQSRYTPLCCRISRLLAVAADDPDLLALHSLTRILHLERNILDQESPNLVAEPVGIQMTLHAVSLICPSPSAIPIP